MSDILQFVLCKFIVLLVITGKSKGNCLTELVSVPAIRKRPREWTQYSHMDISINILESKQYLVSDITRSSWYYLSKIQC